MQAASRNDATMKFAKLDDLIQVDIIAATVVLLSNVNSDQAISYLFN